MHYLYFYLLLFIDNEGIKTAQLRDLNPISTSQGILKSGWFPLRFRLENGNSQK